MDAKLLALGQQVGALLKARGETVSVAESSTGGLIAASLLAVPGASAYFLGGAVVYTRKARELLMALPSDAVRGIRSASEPYALLLAKTSQQRFASSWGLSETGATGPTGNPYGDAAGHSCLAVVGSGTGGGAGAGSEADPGQRERVITLETGSSDRLGNMNAFACASLSLFVQVLNEANG